MNEKSMPNKVFRIKGSFRKNRKKMNFTKEVPAHSEDRAVELIYSNLGSKHAVKRNLIEINEIEEIETED